MSASPVDHKAKAQQQMQLWDRPARAASSEEASHDPDPWDEGLYMLTTLSTDDSAEDPCQAELNNLADDFGVAQSVQAVGHCSNLWGVEPSALLSEMLGERLPFTTSLHEGRNSNTVPCLPEQLSSAAGSRTLPHDSDPHLHHIQGHGFMHDWSAADATSVQAHDWAAFPDPSAGEPRPQSMPNSTLCFPISLPSKQELELVRLLERSRRQLDELLNAKQERGTTGALRRKAAEGMQHMQRLVAALEVEVEKHQQLQSRYRTVSMHLALAEQEQRWMQLDAAHAHAPLAVSARLLARGHGGYGSRTRAAGCGALVSVFQLPRTASEWDSQWDNRVRSLGVLDLLHLHRQWLSRSALLLPKVRVMKGTPEGQAAKAELEELYERHNCFTQRVLRLAPDAWNESCKYDLDTMDLLPQAPNKAYIDKWASCHFPGEWAVAQEILQTYGKVLTDLHQEQVLLQERYAALSARPSCVVADLSGAAGPACSGEDTATAEQVLAQLQANIAQQELQHNNCIHAVTYMQPIEVMVNIKLTVYPLALNGQELL